MSNIVSPITLRLAISEAKSNYRKIKKKYKFISQFYREITRNQLMMMGQNQYEQQIQVGLLAETLRLTNLTDVYAG